MGGVATDTSHAHFSISARRKEERKKSQRCDGRNSKKGFIGRRRAVNISIEIDSLIYGCFCCCRTGKESDKMCEMKLELPKIIRTVLSG